MTGTTRNRWCTLLAALALLVCAGCTAGPGPERRHAELEWELRHHMPQWTEADWNAWEAELAAALDYPPPDPPMFPDAADAPDDPDADPGEDEE